MPPEAEHGLDAVLLGQSFPCTACLWLPQSRERAPDSVGEDDGFGFSKNVMTKRIKSSGTFDWTSGLSLAVGFFFPPRSTFDVMAALVYNK